MNIHGGGKVERGANIPVNTMLDILGRQLGDVWVHRHEVGCESFNEGFPFLPEVSLE